MATYTLCIQHCRLLICLARDFRNKEPVGSRWSCICRHSDSFPRVCNIGLLRSVSSSWSSNTVIFMILWTHTLMVELQMYFFVIIIIDRLVDISFMSSCLKGNIFFSLQIWRECSTCCFNNRFGCVLPFLVCWDSFVHTLLVSLWFLVVLLNVVVELNRQRW